PGRGADRAPDLPVRDLDLHARPGPAGQGQGRREDVLLREAAVLRARSSLPAPRLARAQRKVVLDPGSRGLVRPGRLVARSRVGGDLVESLPAPLPALRYGRRATPGGADHDDARDARGRDGQMSTNGDSTPARAGIVLGSLIAVAAVANL